MKTSFMLDNYGLSKSQLARSSFLSAYSTRHFSHAKDSCNWNQKIVHSLIGFVESLPVLGQIASVVERVLVKHLLGELPQANIQKRPFYSGVAKYSMNEAMTPKFGKYAQGIVELKAKDIIPEDFIGDNRVVSVDFLTKKGKVFKTYTSPNNSVDADTYRIFMLNMPYRKEIQADITIHDVSKTTGCVEEEKLKLSFTVDRIKGIYRSERNDENGLSVVSEPMPKEVTIGPSSLAGPHAYDMCAAGIGKYQRIIIQGNNNTNQLPSLLFPAVQPSQHDEKSHYRIENKSQHMSKLTFKFFRDYGPNDNVPLYQSGKPAVTLPIIVAPKETVSLSKEYLMNVIIAEIKTATGIDITQNDVASRCELHYIHQGIFGFEDPKSQE